MRSDSKFGIFVFVWVLLVTMGVVPCSGMVTGTKGEEGMEGANKKMALAFVQEFFGDMDLTAADRYISPDKYIQHNPLLGDGREALKTAAVGWFKGQTKKKMDVRHVAADGDLVWIHMKSKWGGKDAAVVDIFRFEGGKITEHWDVIQEFPDKSANSNSLI